MKDDCGESSPIPSGSQSTKSTPSTRQESKEGPEATGSRKKIIAVQVMTSDRGRMVKELISFNDFVYLLQKKEREMSYWPEFKWEAMEKKYPDA